MPVAVHNAVNCSKNNLSSFMIYKYVYVLHLTEVLLINMTKMKLCVCVRGCVWEKLWLPLTIKQHVSYKENFFVFYVFVSLSFF